MFFVAWQWSTHSPGRLQISHNPPARFRSASHCRGVILYRFHKFLARFLSELAFKPLTLVAVGQAAVGPVPPPARPAAGLREGEADPAAQPVGEAVGEAG